MGWATYDEFAAPLHERENDVLTADATPLRTGFRSVGSVDQLVREHPDEEVWMIGGATVHTETISEADALVLTQVVGDFTCTKFFPPYEADFRLGDPEARSSTMADSAYRFEVWRRLASRPEGAA